MYNYVHIFCSTFLNIKCFLVQAHTDKNTGKVFYYHPTTRQTTWSDPRSPPSPPARDKDHSRGKEGGQLTSPSLLISPASPQVPNSKDGDTLSGTNLNITNYLGLSEFLWLGAAGRWRLREILLLQPNYKGHILDCTRATVPPVPIWIYNQQEEWQWPGMILTHIWIICFKCFSN